ncbi:MAG: hypothetical protein M3548_19895 [Actinomycetota bacterium]|nr:hypothetical protein [Actinomycetota bacterium]
MVLQGTKKDSSRALMLLALEVVRLMEMMRQVHSAHAQLERARELQRHAGALTSAIDQARRTRNWQDPPLTAAAPRRPWQRGDGELER